MTGKAYGPDNPETVVRIVVDTAYVAATAPANDGQVDNGVYMMDNRASNGSTDEGTIELHTVAHVEDFIGFYVEPADPNSQDTIKFLGFMSLENDCFTSTGIPRERDADGKFFVGQILHIAESRYRIKCELTLNELQVEIIPFYWDPYLSVN